MGRAKRADDGGMVFHVLNRANARAAIFEKPDDYAAFERVLKEALDRVDMRVLSYCLMPNHWQLVLWPRRDGDLSKFMGWLTLTHTQRWHAHHHTAGTGRLYQGRFKSFPVQDDEHFLTVCRYVERNALRANLVKRAEDWLWNSLWHRSQRDEFAESVLSEWPIACPRQWRHQVNQPQADAEVAALRRSVNRGTPDNGVRMGTAFGRDHNPKAMTIWLAGGGVHAGQTIGATDELGAAAVECVHHVRDLHVTLLHLLGLDDHRLTYLHAGRFKQLSQFGGEVIRELIA